MEAQGIFNVLDNAFSTFMVADMNHGRCDAYTCPDEEEACYYAASDGARTGSIVAAVCRDKEELKDALRQLLCHKRDDFVDDARVVDEVEEREVKESQMFSYLCRKYQLDEHRPVVVDAFCAACLTAICNSLLGKRHSHDVQ